MERKLYRDEQHKTIGGVCAGLAEYLHMDVSIVRVIFLLALILKGGGFLLYVVLWIVLPKKPYEYGTVIPGVDYVAGTEIPAGQPMTGYPKRKSSAGRTIGGMVLLLIGLGLLLDELNIIPDFDMEYFWPVLLIVIGVVVIFSSGRKVPSAAGHHDYIKNDPFNEPKL